jgi:hypothetical protein
MERFLELCGIPRTVEHFILEHIDGEWQGRNITTEEQLLTTFTLVGTNKFVTLEAYRRIMG